MAMHSVTCVTLRQTAHYTALQFENPSIIITGFAQGKLEQSNPVCLARTTSLVDSAEYQKSNCTPPASNLHTPKYRSSDNKFHVPYHI
ncbi:hypothetical protein TSUD_254780 [Trifolium subterraneum]|uniref:Uncharacterized protein n=1 Tax=Trifolium subterraneum TaxID=3900 RepID=A0A2Z6P5I4_TRISU|nr:hypothetical protein TSUD_254780 [Trifolium subterraneum]